MASHIGTLKQMHLIAKVQWLTDRVQTYVIPFPVLVQLPLIELEGVRGELEKERNKQMRAGDECNYLC